MTGRTVPEWIGATPDTPVPPRVRLRIFQNHNGRCHVSNHKIMPGDAWALDHIIALCNGGENRERNLAPILVDKHREKTARDVAEKSKVARMAAKHAGTWPKSRRPLRSRGFPKSRPDFEVQSDV